jgi:hypothetical protein
LSIRGIFDFSVGHVMKIAKSINFLALGGFLIGFGIFLKVAPREGFWPGLAMMLICFGVTLTGTGAAARIARTSRRSRHKDSCDRVARLLAAYPGPVTLKASRTGWFMMGFCIVAGVMAFLSLMAGGDLAVNAFEMGFWALLSAGYSACALLWGELQLDKNGFRATLLSRKQHPWIEVYDFRVRHYSGVQFSVGKPRWLNDDGNSARFVSSNDTLGDNYGLKAEELADLMEGWRSAALYGHGHGRSAAPVSD